MTLNLIVIEGEIEFAIYDSRKSSSTYEKFQKSYVVPKNFARLTVSADVVGGFQRMLTQAQFVVKCCKSCSRPTRSGH